VVFASMLLWGILWGAVGMILAVPIMVSIKVIFSHIRDLKQISILLRG
jgi:predicted PurR-regulated permease PerM